MPIRLLLPIELPRFEEHLIRLPPDDRRMRFECATGDAAIRRYVKGIDLPGAAVFGHFDAQGTLRGAAHVAVSDATAELGLSVEPAHRGRGVGSRLLSRASSWARFRATRMTSQCLVENRWMLSRVRALGFRVERDHETATATLALAPPDAMLAMGSMLDEQAGWWSWGLDASVRRFEARMGKAVIRPEAATPAPAMRS